MMVARVGVPLILALAVPWWSCAPAAADEPALSVWTSIEPQVEIVQRVGGANVRVHALIGAGQSPHAYDPAPRQIAELSEADVYFRVGLPFEDTLLDRIGEIAPHLELVDGRQGIELVPLGEDHGHDHGGSADPHFWLDPTLARRFAETVCTTLSRLEPRQAARYASNLDALVSELDALDQRVASILEPFRGSSIIVFHPSYGYLCRRYGLHQVAVEHEGKEPTGRRLAELVDRAKVIGTRAVFVQPQFSGRAARAIADAINGEVVELDPLARDYISNLETMARRIAAAFPN